MRGAVGPADGDLALRGLQNGGATCAFETEQLVVRYPGASRPSLTQVTLRVPVGTFYAVLGPNGSGKSTLMKALLGFIRPAGGAARIAGRDVGLWTRRELARAVGAVSQAESVTFPLTVGELVAMGRYPHVGPLGSLSAPDHEAIRSALSRCDALELEARSLTTLSGGEFQRVRIARALAQEPWGLALDEPTASLDIRHEMRILELLREAADAGTTVFLITHHLDLAARFADHLLLLDQGRVAAEGVPTDVMRGEILSRVYGWPLAVQADPVTDAPRVTPLSR